MPIYEFECICGYKAERYMKLVSSSSRMICEKCGKWMNKIISLPNTDLKENPRFSRAMGVNVSQIEQAKRLWPDAIFNDKGDLLIRNRKEKVKWVKRRGLIELD